MKSYSYAKASTIKNIFIRPLLALLIMTLLSAAVLSVNLSNSKYVLTNQYLIDLLSASTNDIESVGTIVGTAKQYETLTAGSVTPAEATVSYKWQRSYTGAAPWTYIVGAESNTYTLTIDDNNHYIRLEVTGTGDYTGTMYSPVLGPVGVAAIDITAMAPISGDPYIGQVLTAGELTPSSATATYKWQRADTAGGTYSDISGQTATSYTLTSNDLDKYVKVVAIGSGSYTGTVSAYIGPIKTNIVPIVSVGPISGTATEDSVLTAGTVMASDNSTATVSYQWQRSDSGGTVFSDISGAVNSTYTVSAADLSYYIRVKVVGTGSYSGTLYSNRTGPAVATAINITQVSISGMAQVEQTLTAYLPAGETGTFQWMISSDGISYSNITGAASSTYLISANDFGKYIKVSATGSGNYTGTADSDPTTAVAACPITAISNISGTAVSGYTVSAGAVTPSGATVSYEWRRYASSDVNGSYTAIGTNSSTYTLTETDTGAYIRVAATGISAYRETVVSAYIIPIADTSNLVYLTSIGDITGNTHVYATLTAGTVFPYGATATYQWQRCDTSNGSFVNITGATSKTYITVAGDRGYYLKVVATGSGNYAGTVTSNTSSVIEPAELLSVGAVQGTTTVGSTLAAGEVLPSGATFIYQWQRSTDGTGVSFIDISGATSNIYTLTESDSSLYIRLAVTGIGSYSGTKYSSITGPVTTNPTQVTYLGPVDGLPQVGQTLTAGATTPIDATVTYQWQRSAASGGPFSDITGATSAAYSLTPSDLDMYIRLRVKGSGSYYTDPEWLSSAETSKVTTCPLISISDTIGRAEVGYVLTAGTVLPLGANVTYQWQRYSGGTYTDISGATSNTYTLETADNGYYLRLKATGYNGYTGDVYSKNTGPVGSTYAITSISAITGVTKVGSTLAAGTVLPYGSAVTYQWQSSPQADGTYANISGATDSTYVLKPGDVGRYIKVIAYGTGDYFGEVLSTATDIIAKGTLISISNITGSTISGYTLSAGTISPIGATVTYQWQRSDESGSSYADISGATSATYALTESDAGRYIKVVATATVSGAYEGSVTSAETSLISGSGTPLTSLTSIGATSGTGQVGQTLTAGTVSAGAISPVTSVTYQWQRSDTSGSNFASIQGAVSSTYVLTADDYGRYVRPVATGSGTYTGSVYPTSATQVNLQQSITALGNITGTPAIGETLVAGAVTPSGATVTYQWQLSRTNSTTNFIDISGATNPTYTITDLGRMDKKVIRVVVTGTGAYSGTINSNYTLRIGVSPTYLTAISPINGIAQVGQVLTAGTTTPYGASLTYQWLRKPQGAGTYEMIPGATMSTYTLTSSDFETYIKVVATGAGSFSGYVESESTALVSAAPITGISNITGTTATGQILSAGTVYPVGASVTYKWQRSDSSGNNYTDIAGATTANHTLTAEDLGNYLKIVVTGYGAYTGTAESDPAGPIASSYSTLQSIGVITGTVQVNSTLTAGAVLPSGSTFTYQWLRANSSGGPWAAINGAIASTYMLMPEDYGKYIKVTATGSGAYYGTVQNATVAGPVAACPIASISEFTGNCNVGQALKAGTVLPANATFTYSWDLSKKSNSQWATLGATTSSIVVPPTHVGNASSSVGGYIRVTITGTGAFSGTVTRVIGPIGAPITLTPITAIGQIRGTASPGETLSAGSVVPAEATVSYQWLRSQTSDGTYSVIQGAALSTYVLQSGDMGYYIKLQATGTGLYTGVVLSSPRGPVVDISETTPITAISDIIYATEPEVTLRAGTVYPLGSTVSYQWQISSGSTPDSFIDIIGADQDTYTIPLDQILGKYFRLIVTGTGSYSGTITSSYTGPVVTDAYDLVSVSISGDPKEGVQLSAVSVTAEAAAGSLTPTVTYQWQISTSTGEGAVFSDISGATLSTYTPVAADYNFYLRVAVTGSGIFEGTVYAYTSEVVVGVISYAQITIASPATGADPPSAAQVEALNAFSGYSITGLTWNEPLTAGGKFAASTVYTADMTLTSESAKTFSGSGVTISVPSAASVGTVTVTGTDVGNTAQFTVTFAQTEALQVSSLSIKTQPSKLSYTVATDDILSLLGLVVTETNNDGTTADISFTDGTASGYTASPAHGASLTGANHGAPVAITHTLSGKTANTSNLTVQAPPTAGSVSISGTAQVGQTLTGSYVYSDVNGDLEGTSTFRWYADDVLITGAASQTYLLTAAEQGKAIKFEVMPVAVTGSTTGVAVISEATGTVAP